jgi:hypothetical protein
VAMFIVDRRLNPGSKSLENRQRFLRRAKALVQVPSRRPPRAATSRMSWRVARSQSCWYGINQPLDLGLPDLARRKLAQAESRRSAAGRLSPDFNTRRPSSCAPPLASPASGAIKASAPKPVIFSRRSTAGSPKGFDTPVLQDAKALLDELA